MGNDFIGVRFPAVLRLARQAADLSYRDLAARCGLSHSFLSHLEKGERRAPRMDRVVDIARALDALTPEFLVAALGDRVGEDVGALMAAMLRPAGDGQADGSEHGGLQVETGRTEDLQELRDLAASEQAVAALRRRLYFVDLQFDPDILRVGFSHAGGEPTVPGLVGDGEGDPSA